MAQVLRVLRTVSIQMERFAPCVVVIWLAGTLVTGVAKALYKPLWLDELMEAYIARVPNISEVWPISKSGTDGQPPAYHYAMWTSVRLFGNAELGLRTPSLIGYVVCCVCLYCFISRRSSRLYGLIAMLYPGVTGCWYYATEGRPYGVLLGCTGVAILCWQSIVTGRSRAPALAGLSLSLAGAFSIHYYAPLLAIPFVVAEAVRTYRTRTVDWGVWVALTAPALVIIPALSLLTPLRVNSGTAPPFALPAWHWSLVHTANQFLSPSLIALVGTVFVYIGFQVLWPPTGVEDKLRPVLTSFVFQLEAVLMFALACLPVFVLLISKWLTHIFFPRYGIEFVVGVSAALATAAWVAFSGRRAPALVILIGLAVMSIYSAGSDLYVALRNRAYPIRLQMQNRIPESIRHDDLPIVTGYTNQFMELNYYGDSEVLRRLVYVSSEAFAAQLIGYTNAERMMIASARFFGTHVTDYSTFVKTHPVFYVLGPADWIIPKLIEDGSDIRIIEGGSGGVFADGSDLVLQVHYHPVAHQVGSRTRTEPGHSSYRLGTRNPIRTLR